MNGPETISTDTKPSSEGKVIFQFRRKALLLKGQEDPLAAPNEELLDTNASKTVESHTVSENTEKQAVEVLAVSAEFSSLPLSHEKYHGPGLPGTVAASRIEALKNLDQSELIELLLAEERASTKLRNEIATLPIRIESRLRHELGEAYKAALDEQQARWEVERIQIETDAREESTRIALAQQDESEVIRKMKKLQSDVASLRSQLASSTENARKLQAWREDAIRSVKELLNDPAAARMESSRLRTISILMGERAGVGIRQQIQQLQQKKEEYQLQMEETALSQQIARQTSNGGIYHPPILSAERESYQKSVQYLSWYRLLLKHMTIRTYVRHWKLRAQVRSLKAHVATLMHGVRVLVWMLSCYDPDVFHEPDAAVAAAEAFSASLAAATDPKGGLSAAVSASAATAATLLSRNVAGSVGAAVSAASTAAAASSVTSMSVASGLNDMSNGLDILTSPAGYSQAMLMALGLRLGNDKLYKPLLPPRGGAIGLESPAATTLVLPQPRSSIRKSALRNPEPVNNEPPTTTSRTAMAAFERASHSAGYYGMNELSQREPVATMLNGFGSTALAANEAKTQLQLIESHYSDRMTSKNPHQQRLPTSPQGRFCLSESGNFSFPIVSGGMRATPQQQAAAAATTVVIKSINALATNFSISASSSLAPLGINEVGQWLGRYELELRKKRTLEYKSRALAFEQQRRQRQISVTSGRGFVRNAAEKRGTSQAGQQNSEDRESVSENKIRDNEETQENSLSHDVSASGNPKSFGSQIKSDVLSKRTGEENSISKTYTVMQQLTKHSERRTDAEAGFISASEKHERNQTNPADVKGSHLSNDLSDDEGKETIQKAFEDIKDACSIMQLVFVHIADAVQRHKLVSKVFYSRVLDLADEVNKCKENEISLISQLNDMKNKVTTSNNANANENRALTQIPLIASNHLDSPQLSARAASLVAPPRTTRAKKFALAEKTALASSVDLGSAPLSARAAAIVLEADPIRLTQMYNRQQQLLTQLWTKNVKLFERLRTTQASSMALEGRVSQLLAERSTLRAELAEVNHKHGKQSKQLNKNQAIGLPPLHFSHKLLDTDSGSADGFDRYEGYSISQRSGNSHSGNRLDASSVGFSNTSREQINSSKPRENQSRAVSPVDGTFSKQKLDEQLSSRSQDNEASSSQKAIDANALLSQTLTQSLVLEQDIKASARKDSERSALDNNLEKKGKSVNFQTTSKNTRGSPNTQMDVLASSEQNKQSIVSPEWIFGPGAAQSQLDIGLAPGLAHLLDQSYLEELESLDIDDSKLPLSLRNGITTSTETLDVISRGSSRRNSQTGRKRTKGGALNGEGVVKNEMTFDESLLVSLQDLGPYLIEPDFGPPDEKTRLTQSINGIQLASSMPSIDETVNFLTSSLSDVGNDLDERIRKAQTMHTRSSVSSLHTAGAHITANEKAAALKQRRQLKLHLEMSQR